MSTPTVPTYHGDETCLSSGHLPGSPRVGGLWTTVGRLPPLYSGRPLGLDSRDPRDTGHYRSLPDRVGTCVWGGGPHTCVWDVSGGGRVDPGRTLRGARPDRGVRGSGLRVSFCARVRDMFPVSVFEDGCPPSPVGTSCRPYPGNSPRPDGATHRANRGREGRSCPGTGVTFPTQTSQWWVTFTTQT